MNNSPFHLHIKLNQVTPLIHFQHQHQGATIRATELKPKIDRFIIEELHHHEPQFAENFAKYISKIKNAVENKINTPYKVSVKADIKEKWILHSANFPEYKEGEVRRKGWKTKSNMPYFADNDSIRKSKWDEVNLAITYENITLNVFSIDQNIVKVINKALPYVFTLNNFGLRQNKGFGCFHIEGMNPELFERILSKNRSRVFFRELKGKEDPLQVINKEYKLLKNPPQNTSKLEEYFADKYAKENVKINSQLKRNGRTDDEDARYIRAMLGVAELYQYPQRDVRFSNVIIKDAQGEIDRFQSPITFKVFDGLIYAITQKMPDVIFDRKFKFTAKDGKREVGTTFINTPPKESFNLSQFLYDSWIVSDDDLNEFDINPRTKWGYF